MGGVQSVNYWNANIDDLLERFQEGKSGNVNSSADDLMDMVIGIASSLVPARLR